MGYEIGNIYCDDFMNNGLPDKSVQLIIADPPYFEVKGDFDFIWKSFDDYLADVEKWAKECKRILADNGTLFWYGDRKNIAYSQVILDKYFNFLNHIFWQKSEKCQMEMFDTLRSFYCRGYERILVYENGVEPGKSVYQNVMEYIRKEREKIGWNYNDMDSFLGIKASSCFWDKETSHEYVIPTLENWIKLQKTGCFQKPYEELRKEYEELRRPFNNWNHYGDVIHLPNLETCDYDHDTIKPERLTRDLITTCSRPGDIVFVPFSGSGTECAMAQREGRKYIGFDVCEKYVIMGNERCKKEKEQPSLFDAAPSKDLTKPVDAPTLFED